MATLILPKAKHHELTFIVSSCLDKPDPNARQLIRSHVMRGKNKRKPAADRLKLKSWINQESGPYIQTENNSAAVPSIYFPLPNQLGSDLPLTHFACDMPPYALDLIFKFFTVLEQAIYPIELCLMFNAQHSVWIEWLAVDALYCHSVLWITQTYFDWLRGVKYSPTLAHHAHETLVLLQQRLNDNQLATSYTTLGAVVGLVMMNALAGDEESSIKHMMGLYKMVELRGGVKTLSQNSQLQLKVCRADLLTALLTSNKPTFFPKNISWEPYIAKVSIPSHEHLSKQLATLNVNLRNVWADLREFSRSANLAFQTGQKMDPVLFQEILVSVQYRLLLLDVSPGSTEELFYLGMLAFSTNIFLQMQGLAMQFEKLSDRLRDSILGLEQLEEKSTKELKLWLLFVAHMFIFSNKKDSWIKCEMSKTLKIVGMSSWKPMKNLLKEYLWIDVTHDRDGQKAFDEALQY